MVQHNHENWVINSGVANIQNYFKIPNIICKVMKQTKKQSLFESIVQTIIGLLTSIIIQMIIYPLLGIPVAFFQNLIITAVFFIVSIIRGYFVRRLFNKN